MGGQTTIRSLLYDVNILQNAPSSDDVVIINSIIEENHALPRGCVLLHTHLSHSPLLTIENNVVIAGLKKKDFTVSTRRNYCNK